MRRGQISIDFLFAVTLIAILSLNLVYISSSQKTQAQNFDVTTKLKVFAVDVRDSVANVYAMGEGFKVKKSAPFKLQTGDNLTVILDNVTNSIVVTGTIGGKEFYVMQRSPVPIYTQSKVVLTSDHSTFWIVTVYNATEGRLYVEVSP